jgi:integrase
MRGSIAKRSAGSFTIQASGGFDDGGRRQRFTRTVRGTRRDAERALTGLLREIDTGAVAMGEREPVIAYLERWIAHRVSIGKLRPKTATVYRGYVRREVSPRIGAMRIGDVRPVHVQRVIDEALGSGLSARSVVQLRAIMRAAFQQAVRWRLVSVNPLDGVTPPKVEAPKLRIPSAKDVAALLACVTPDYRVPLAVAAGTGLRRGEILAIEWGSVDLEGVQPSLHVAGTLQRVAGELVVLPPKTTRSRRTVPLPASLVALLRTHRANQLERRLLVGPAWTGEYVFDRGDGRPVDPDAFGKAFRNSRTAAGLEGVRLHDLRHGFASMLVAAGTNLRIVSDVLGHATVGFTLQTYVHPDDEAAATVATEAERLLGPALA